MPLIGELLGSRWSTALPGLSGDGEAVLDHLAGIGEGHLVTITVVQSVAVGIPIATGCCCQVRGGDHAQDLRSHRLDSGDGQLPNLAVVTENDFKPLGARLDDGHQLPVVEREVGALLVVVVGVSGEPRDRPVFVAVMTHKYKVTRGELDHKRALLEVQDQLRHFGDIMNDTTTNNSRPSALDEVEPVYDAADVAQILRITRQSAYRLIRSGQLRSVKIGRLVRVPKSALDMYLHGDEAA